ncbi:HpsJ family protein [Calothrix rhizosoleniae]|uniref:hormogonium polysaccharide biosynthesis protein HpsJ n=1 Tax=Calothrix rhizosoleniae TaxID=888997 RepID=UPI000B49A9A1|nr:HpsJ family protein [Calothrix rhizosoleniae]
MINRFNAVNAARTLTVGGIVLMLSFLLDVFILIFPFQPTDGRWQIALVTALVDRGIVPMVGLGMLFTGYWIGSIDNKDSDSTNPESSTRKPIFDLRFPSLIFASILGLIFLVFFPLHLNNVRQISNQRVEKISQDAEKAENQLKNQLSKAQAQLNSEQGKAQIQQLRTRTKNQLAEIIKDETKYKQALDSPKIPAAVKEVLKKAKANPQQLETLINEQTNPLAAAQKSANQELNKIRSNKEKLEQRARQEAWKSGLRTGLSSLLLSVGYTIIGWTGLRSMNNSSGKKHKSAVR